MKFTVALPQSNRVSSPTALRDVAQAADDLGYWALSMHDHLLFDGGWTACGSDRDNGTEDVRSVYEPITTYAHLAALTKNVELLFSIMLMPAREPLMAAKQLATLDQLSGGRVLVGIGVGLSGNDNDPWPMSMLNETARREWEALKVPVRQRGKLTNESIAAMRKLWTEEEATFDGELLQFENLAFFPKPARPGGPPIYIGGNSPAALERAARGGFSWLGAHRTPEEVAESVMTLKSLHDKHGTKFTEEVVIDLYMRLDESREQAIQSASDWIGQAFGPQVATRNMFGNSEELITQVKEYADHGTTALDLKPRYHSIEDLIAMLERFAAEVFPEVGTTSRAVAHARGAVVHS